MSTRYMLLILFIIGGPLLGCVYYWWQLRETHAREIEEVRHRSELRAHQLSESVAQQVDASLRSVDTALRHLRSVYVRDRGNLLRASQDMLSAYPEGMVEDVKVFGEDGYLAYSLPPSNGRTFVGDKESFRAFANSSEDRISIGKPLTGPSTGQPLMQITRPIYDGPRYLGIIGISLRSTYISSNLALLGIVPTDLISIIHADGQIIARNRNLEAGLKSSSPPDRPYLHASPGDSGVFRANSMIDHTPLLFSWHCLANWPICVVAGVDEQSDFYAVEQRQAVEVERTLLSISLVMAFALGIVISVAKIERGKRELAESEERYRALFEHSKVPMLLIDPLDGQIADANEAATNFYGYDRKRICQLHITEINQLSAEEVTAEMAKAMAQDRDCFFFSHRLANGKVRQVEVRAGPLEIGGHKLLYSLVHDITERRAAELALASETQRLSALLATSTDGIHILDEEGNLVQFSHSFATMLGYESDEIRRFNVRDWDAGLPQDNLVGMVRAIIKRPGRFETKHRRKDGSLIDVEITATGIEIEGKWYQYASSRDISEHNRAMLELRKAKAEAETANLAKSRFLATMSHEIRTPLNGIIGMAQMLLMEDLRENERQDFARTILNSGGVLLTILNDILDLSKIEAGKFELVSIPFEPVHIIRDVTALLAETASSKGLGFEAEWLGPPGQRYVGDPYRLRQMLANYVSNAIKFTSLGKIRIELNELERDIHNNSAILEFSVIDTGIGISERTQKALFEPFSQADNSITRQYGGTGLGLSIVRSLAEMMKGEVGVHSRIGEGSRFYFRIRAGIAANEQGDYQSMQQRAESVLSSSALPKFAGHVLVAEDNPTNVKVIFSMLSKLGLTVSIAEDGQQAVEALEGGLSVDLVFMDIHMPILDGYAATQKIRQREDALDLPRLPIIAVTANAFEEDRRQSIAVGMDDLLAKPFVFKALQETLKEWLPDKRQSQLELSGAAPLDQTTLGETQEAVSSYSLPKVAGFDIDAALDRVAGDIEQYLEILTLYRQITLEGIDEIHKAVLESNISAVRAVAHSNKGSSGSVGAVGMEAAFAALERSAKEGAADPRLVLELDSEWEAALWSLKILLDAGTKAQGEKGFYQ